MASFLDWLLELPKEIDRAVYEEAGRQIKEKAMPFVTFADRYEREQGKIEGKAEGRLEGLEALLEAKFQDAGLALMPELRKIEDPERLGILLQTVRKATSLDDVRKLLSQPPAH